jgi:hypothetical protein|tara:strand:+ start:290 stop:448 length:159 start_codon:yes stop_codon:yes gene_type:complete
MSGIIFTLEEKIEFVEKEIPEEVLEELRNHFQTLYAETFENILIVIQDRILF